MEESTSTFLYTATYVFVFIIATSLSIGLYFTVNKYADSAFDYSKNLNSSIINTPTTGTEEKNFGRVYLSRDDVFSYYVNYAMKDIYGGASNTNNDVEYLFTFNHPNQNASITVDSYYDLHDILQGADKYYLDYQDEYVKDGKKHVQIQILIPENEP
jgi:hypothetical protein